MKNFGSIDRGDKFYIRPSDGVEPILVRIDDMLGLRLTARTTGGHLAFVGTMTEFREVVVSRAPEAPPERSRVQEMADRKWPERKGIGWGADFSAREETVRTIIDWLLNGCRHGEDSSDEYATVIAREFLGVDAGIARAPVDAGPASLRVQAFKRVPGGFETHVLQMSTIQLPEAALVEQIERSSELERALAIVLEAYEVRLGMDKQTNPTVVDPARALLAKLKASRLP